jgi:predicted MFS family arabinose efflux permease
MGRAMATMYIALEAGIGIGAFLAGSIYPGKFTNLPLPFFIAGILALFAFILLFYNRKKWSNNGI